MSSKIRILIIAPYSSMKSLLMKVSEEYNNIDLTVTVGDLNKGVEIAKKNFHENYDVIISRGGTAKLLQQSVSIPVIEINTSAYDILRTLKLSDARNKKVAIIGFLNITENLLALKEVLPYEIDIFTIDSPDEARIILQKLKNDNYKSILCDMITYTISRELGINTFLITSGIESIRSAFDTAIICCSSYKNTRIENHFLRQLIHGRDSQTVVYTKDKKLFYSTINDDNSNIFKIIYDKIDEVPKEGKRRFLHRENNILYSILSKRIISDEVEYIAFYFTSSKIQSANNRCGINYSNHNEIEKDYFNNIYIVMDSLKESNLNIDKLIKTNNPIIIYGEEGTGKDQITKSIYLQSTLKNQPFIEIDCTLLKDKIWSYLLNHHNSPLCGSDNTIFIKNINILNDQMQKELFIALIDMDVSKRNKLIFSFITNNENTYDSNINLFINKLHCFIINLPSLRENPSHIDFILKLYLNRLTTDAGKEIIGFSPEAVSLMCKFSWPYNYLQFHRVINELISISDGPYISAENVKEILKKEEMIKPVSNTKKTFANSLNLSDPLGKINKQIAEIVIESNNGNQSKAAESLGISRTTLWRLIKSD